jgi:spermidine/putrescine transport system ATP-binding protein
VADFIGETNFVEGMLVACDGMQGLVEIAEGTRLRGVLPYESMQPDQRVTVAIRPEKIGVFPAEGEYKLIEGETVSARDYFMTLRSQINTAILSGEVEQVFYIGTDTRYDVRLTEQASLVARIQNFGHRHDTIYKKGDQVHVYWEVENARVLSH